jgi:pimeloyl-ACP methyl ester carboxylesterase
MRQILFVQGGGPGAYDEWDDKLVASLARELGGKCEVRYPRMPDEGDPSYAAWGAAIRREMAGLDDGAVVVGHSVGGTLLVQTLADQPPRCKLRGIVLIGAPFVGPGGWPGEEFELPGNLGARLPQGVWVHVFHGLDDQTAPPSHAELYARAIGPAQLHLMPGRDHQLNDDLGDVAKVIDPHATALRRIQLGSAADRNPPIVPV